MFEIYYGKFNQLPLFNTGIFIFRCLISIIPMYLITKTILYIVVLTKERSKMKCDGRLFAG